MNYLTLFQFVFVAAYLLIVGKVLTSISESYYYLRAKGKNHLFYYFTGLLGVSMLAQSATYDYGNTARILFALSGFFLPAISIAANSKERAFRQDLIHIIATYSSIAFTLLGTTCYLWPEESNFKSVALAVSPIVILTSSIILLRNEVNKTYWIEVIAIVVILLPLIKKP